MADNDQDNDEYKFDELESFDSESMDDTHQSANPASSRSEGLDSERKNIIRNAVIVVGAIILAMVMYKLIAMMFSGKNTVVTNKNAITPIAQVSPEPTPKPSTPAPIIATPTPTPTPVLEQHPAPSVVDTDLKEKVAAIEQSQQSVKAEVSSVGQQVGTVNNNINNLNTQIANLNQIISNLSNQVTKQSQEINTLMARSQPKPVKRVVRHVKVMQQRITFYIQAVIPGRAWLIGSNGSTLTVREGTKVAGYGTVKLIDSIQGRILTSSGQVIKFSQEDS